MAYNPEAYRAAQQRKLQERQLEMQNDPGRIFLKALAQSVPQATFNALGQMAVKAADYELFGGRKKLDATIDLNKKKQKEVERAARVSEGLAREKESRLLATEQRKQKDKVNSEMDKFVEVYNDKAFTMQDAESRASFIKNNVRKLVNLVARLPESQRSAATANLQAAGARLVGEDVIAYEKALIDEYGKVRNLAKYRPQVTKVDVPSATDISGAVSGSTKRALELNSQLSAVQTSYDSNGGDEAFMALARKKQEGKPFTAEEKTKFDNLNSDRSKAKKLNVKIEEQLSNIATARGVRNKKALVQTESYPLAKGSLVTHGNSVFVGSSFPGAKRSDLPADIKLARDAEDLAIKLQNDQGLLKQAVTAIGEKDPSLANQVSQQIKGQSMNQQMLIIAKTMLENDISAGSTVGSRVDISKEDDNLVKNVVRKVILPKVDLNFSSGTFQQLDRINNLPLGTFEKVSKGGVLSPDEQVALAGLGRKQGIATSFEEDPGFITAQKKNPWLTIPLYFTLDSDGMEKVQQKSYETAEISGLYPKSQMKGQ